MKKSIIIILLCFNLNIVLGQGEEKAAKIGLISELVYFKESSENTATFILNNNSIEVTKKNEFIKKYNENRLLLDQLIVQLISDCRVKNNLRYFKKLDELLTIKSSKEISENDSNEPKVKGYIRIIIKITATQSSLSNYMQDKDSINSKGFLPASMSVEEATGVLTLVTSTIKEIRESKEKKVEKITTILNDLRLLSPQDLIKKEEPKDKKE